MLLWCSGILRLRFVKKPLQLIAQDPCGTLLPYSAARVSIFETYCQHTLEPCASHLRLNRGQTFSSSAWSSAEDTHWTPRQKISNQQLLQRALVEALFAYNRSMALGDPAGATTLHCTLNQLAQSHLWPAKPWDAALGHDGLPRVPMQESKGGLEWGGTHSHQKIVAAGLSAETLHGNAAVRDPHTALGNASAGLGNASAAPSDASAALGHMGHDHQVGSLEWLLCFLQHLIREQYPLQGPALHMFAAQSRAHVPHSTPAQLCSLLMQWCDMYKLYVTTAHKRSRPRMVSTQRKGAPVEGAAALSGSNSAEGMRAVQKAEPCQGSNLNQGAAVLHASSIDIDRRKVPDMSTVAGSMQAVIATDVVTEAQRVQGGSVSNATQLVQGAAVHSSVQSTQAAPVDDDNKSVQAASVDNEKHLVQTVMQQLIAAVLPAVLSIDTLALHASGDKSAVAGHAVAEVKNASDGVPAHSLPATAQTLAGNATAVHVPSDSTAQVRSSPADGALAHGVATDGPAPTGNMPACNTGPPLVNCSDIAICNLHALHALHLHAVLHSISIVQHPLLPPQRKALNRAFAAVAPTTPAAAVVELFECCKRWQALPLYLQSAIPDLCAAFLGNMAYCTSWDVMTFLLILVKWQQRRMLQQLPLSRADLETWGARVNELMHLFKGRRFANLLWALSKVGHVPTTICCTALGHHLTMLAAHSRPDDLATMLASWNHLRLSQSLLGRQHIGRIISLQLRNYTAHDLTIVIGTMALWNVRPATLDPKELAQVISTLLPKFKAQDVAGIIRQLHVIDVPLQLLHQERLSGAIWRNLRKFTPRQLLHVISGFGLHAYVPQLDSERDDELGEVIMQAVPKLDVYDIEVLLFALATLNLLPASVDLRMLAVLLQRKSLPPRELALQMQHHWAQLWPSYSERDGFDAVGKVLDWWCVVA